MALTPGSSLGAYRILSLLGAGGMGEVYRARDTRLNRDVALKILPPLFAADPDRLARFRREAQVLAALNHPNIAGIYGFEEGASVSALVLELVDGPTLADRIAAGPIPIDEVLPIAAQICEALEAAHEHGIVHRDLKPQNIKMATSGAVKVLDFGLAKLEEGSVTAASALVSNSPTITSPAMTGIGVVLGTAAYMAPEQARGAAVDKRADIWGFGCVLYEMVTGVRAFEGTSVAETLANVLKAEPDWDRIPRGIPARVIPILRACLRKDPRQRLGDAQSLRLALAGALDAPAAVAPPRAKRRLLPFAAGAAIGAALMAGTASVYRSGDATGSVVRTEIPTFGVEPFTVGGIGRGLAITPDGSTIAFLGVNREYLIRRLDELAPKRTPFGAAGARGPFVSPDGQWIASVSTPSVIKTPISGGSADTIAPIAAEMAGLDGGGTWGDDGTIVYATTAVPSGLQRISGGQTMPLTTPDRTHGESDHLWPELLPGAKAVLFTIIPTTGGLSNAQIAVLDLRTNAKKVLVRGASDAKYARSGHLLYGAGGALRVVAFDADRLEVTGTPVTVVEQVFATPQGAVNAVISANGTLVYLPGAAGATRSLTWVDRDGREEPIPAPVRAYEYPRISPDGTRVAINLRDADQDIWTWDFGRQILTRVTLDPAVDQYPVWSSDGKRLIYGSQRAGATNLYSQAADGTGAVERLTNTPLQQLPYALAPGGTEVVVREAPHPETGQDLMTVRLGPAAQSKPLVQSTFRDSNGEFAPGGQWLAYESTESGREEIYVRPYPDVDKGRWQISNGGGRTPLWSRDGKELFYVSPDGMLMAVRVEAGTTWRNSAPAPILKGRYFYNLPGLGRTYDIAPDGRRFLMIKESDASTTRNLVVVQNFFQELRRLAPPK